MKIYVTCFLIFGIIISSCKEQATPCKDIPILSVDSIAEITANSARVHLTITAPTCNQEVIQQGFVYSEKKFPEVEGKDVTTRIYYDKSYKIERLEHRKTYFVRAFLENSNGIHYSEQKEFKVVNEELFYTCLGGINFDTGLSVKQTFTGDFLIAGVSTSNDGNLYDNKGKKDGWIVKLSKTSQVIWQHNMGGSNDDAFNSVCLTTDGGCLVVGETLSVDGDITFNKGSSDAWVIKLDSDGNVVWQQTFGGTYDDGANYITNTKDGGYIIAGYSRSFDGDVTGNKGSEDVWLLKLNADGAVDWQNSYGGKLSDIGNSVQETLDGGYIVAANTYSSNGNVAEGYGLQDAWVFKTDSRGKLIWERTIGSTKDDGMAQVIQSKEGYYMAVGNKYNLENSSSDLLILKLSETGSVISYDLYGENGIDGASSIVQAEDGNFFISGTIDPDGGASSQSDLDLLVMKTDQSGTVLWEKTYGGVNMDVSSEIQLTDKGMVVVGSTYSYTNEAVDNHSEGMSDFFILNMNSGGTFDY
ncbi:hypothetical protein ACE1ET_00750 [Saccharicrinis sp. FJH62]|uniref:hypothetical protein n=1 Tax=Saccharicrinis sp. FJH62 TaxID=3344657 RepID=UPI0035D45AC5